MRVLAVDDDTQFLEIFHDALVKIGLFHVTLVESGAAALEVLSDPRDPGFDIIFLDILMPSMDGVELCRRVRALPQCTQTPILMLTAAQGRKWIYSAFDAGANDYISKPLDQLELETRIDNARRLVAWNNQNVVSVDKEYASDVPIYTCLSGVRGLLDTVSLHNFVLQLSRFDLLFLGSLAITFPEVSVVRWSVGVGAFRKLLADYSEAIREACGTEDAMIGYVEDGTFIIVGELSRDCNPFRLRRRLETRLAAKRIRYSDGTSAPTEFEILSGKKFMMMGAKSAYEALLDLEDAAQTVCTGLKKTG